MSNEYIKYNAEWHSNYYEDNREHLLYLMKDWKTKNRSKWNLYQAWWSKRRNWEKKLLQEPNSEKIIKKLQEINAQKPS